LLLTLSNPMTILAFAAVFASFGIAEAQERYASATALVLGVFCGSALGWLALSSMASLFRERLDTSALRWVNRISGILVTGFGLAAMVSLL
jgi:threonine/homoserine/homoserine lactone efflux protein